jgi:4-amino-4-deoxy-L-arabinose transferase-like glycosyltransferase
MTLHRRAWSWLSANAHREATVAAVLAFSLFFAGTADIPILGRDEARFAQASREMLAAGELVVPTFGGVDRYHKPILIYWCTMASCAAFGVNPRAARLPSNLAGAFAVALLAWHARRRLGPGAGLLAGCLLAVSVVFYAEAKGCTADMVMLLAMLVMMFAFERLLAGSSAIWDVLLFWVGMGLAVLAKGPIGPAWVVMTALALYLMQRRWQRWEVWCAVALLVLGWWLLGPIALLPPLAAGAWHLIRSHESREHLRRLRPGLGVLLLAIVVLPWGLAAVFATDWAFLREGVGHHVIDRSFTAFESHGGFPAFYLVTAVITAFPWIAVVADAAVHRDRHTPTHSWWRFQVAWLVGPVLLLELVQTKLVHYWMPSYPAGILLAVWWLLAPDRRSFRLAIGSRLLLLAGGVLLAVVPIALPIYLELGELVAPGVVAGSLMAAGTAIAFVMSRRRPLAAVVAGTVGCALYLAALALAYLPALGAELIGPRAGRRVVELRQNNEDVLVYRARDDEIFFYLPVELENCRTAECLSDRIAGDTPFLGAAREQDLEQYLDSHPEARLVIVDRVEGLDVVRGRRARIVVFRPMGTSGA